MPLLSCLKWKCKTDTLVDIYKDKRHVPYLTVTSHIVKTDK